MIRKPFLAQLPLLASLILCSEYVRAETKLPSILGENMVLQRDQPLPIWGWENPGEKVTVSLDGHKLTTRADDQGQWMVALPAMKAGGPHRLTVSGSSTITLKNILIGEVWLCSGQSNMEWTVAKSNDAEKEIAAGQHPRIRHIKIPHRPALTPQNDVPTDGWQICTPETVTGFTAVGYYFGRHLLEQLDVPVGLVGSNWGGTRIEPWIPPTGFEQTPALKDITDHLKDFPSRNDQGRIIHQSPLALYNGMIHPLVPYAIRGAIWYQGESNNGEGMLYHEKMKALINGWRSTWQRDDMPFYFVQLAPFRYERKANDLPEIWEAQQETLSLPHTGMAITTDISNLDDIHPKNKQEVGRRLALWALAKTYDHDQLVYSGPLFKSMTIETNQIRIAFDHASSGLASRNGKPLNWFTICGQDKKFVEAEARIDGTTVVVHAETVSSPLAVRFGWDQLAEPNLINLEGLPAPPFRTDRD